MEKWEMWLIEAIAALLIAGLLMQMPINGKYAYMRASRTRNCHYLSEIYRFSPLSQDISSESTQFPYIQIR